LAKELHFGRAAQRLTIAQPTLSQQIRKLEQEIGVQLLARGTHHVSLTEPGIIYLEEARAILERTSNATVAAQRAQRGEIGRLAVGFVGLAALDTLPTLLGRYRVNYPNVALTLFERSNEEQIQTVRDGTLDVGVVREPASISGLASLRLFSDAQVVALPARHRLARQRVVQLADLRSELFLITPRATGTALYDRIIGACDAEGFSPRIVQEVLMMTTMIGLVAANIGVAILPSVAAKVLSRQVVFRQLRPAIEIETGLIWHPATIGGKPTLAALVDIARDAFSGRQVKRALGSRGSLATNGLKGDNLIG
jgi:DNA-binding transcriptional LysR family regulator